MGSYATLKIGDFSLGDWKSFISFEPLLPFSPRDLRCGTLVDEGKKYRTFGFVTTVGAARRRLEERGITIPFCRSIYTDFRSDRVWHFAVESGEDSSQDIEMTFEEYFLALGKIFKTRKHRYPFDFQPEKKKPDPPEVALVSREDFFREELGQYFSDVGFCLDLRIFLEIAKPNQHIELDFSELVHGGYVEESEVEGLFSRFFDLMLRRIALDYQIYGFVIQEDPRVDTRIRHKLEIASEDQLIDGVLHPLLGRMGFERLRRVRFHGPNEFGSDILPFRRRTPLGTLEYYALQAKAVPIHGTSSRPGNAAEVLSQAAQALAVTFIDDLDNERKRVDKFIVACSKSISGAARRVIEDAIEGKRALIFLDQDKLLELIKEHHLVQHVLFADSDQADALGQRKGHGTVSCSRK
jgi:hypothetical protein